MPSELSPSAASSVGPGALRNTAVALLFAAVALVSRLLHVRRNPRSWWLFRALLAISGAALVVLPLGVWNNWLLAIAGLLTFLTAALLPPYQHEFDSADKARELGAMAVVEGGAYQPAAGAAVVVDLYLCPQEICVVDKSLEPLLAIPVVRIHHVQAVPFDDQWSLQIDWDATSALFLYSGFFARHLALKAESAVLAHLQTFPGQEPAGQKVRSRAAGA